MKIYFIIHSFSYYSNSAVFLTHTHSGWGCRHSLLVAWNPTWKSHFASFKLLHRKWGKKRFINRAKWRWGGIKTAVPRLTFHRAVLTSLFSSRPATRIEKLCKPPHHIFRTHMAVGRLLICLTLFTPLSSKLPTATWTLTPTLADEIYLLDLHLTHSFSSPFQPLSVIWFE